MAADDTDWLLRPFREPDWPPDDEPE